MDDQLEAIISPTPPRHLLAGLGLFLANASSAGDPNYWGVTFDLATVTSHASLGQILRGTELFSESVVHGCVS